MKKPCAVCGKETSFAFAGVAMGKYNFDAVGCPQCGLLQFDEPKWLEEAYGDAIVDTDTGLVQRNLALNHRLVPLLFHLFGPDGRYVDLAGGTGLFVRLMRDSGCDYYWKDKYCENIHARGFEFVGDKECCAVTAFEVLEHLLDPVAFITESLRETKAKLFIFSTECYEGQTPDPETWWYYSLHSGQHISFFQRKTLASIADQLGLVFTTYEDIHFIGEPTLIYKLQHLVSSKWRRKLAARRARKTLKSKTWSDHLHLKELHK